MRLPDLSDPRTPTWAELQLNGHVSRVKVSLALYVVSVLAVWMLIVGARQVSETKANLVFYLAAANWLFLVWSAYRIQHTLYESGLHEYSGVRVWVFAFLLNPLLLGWYVPVRVLFIARQTRDALEARWPQGRPTASRASA